MTDQELQQFLSSKFDTHEVDVPADDWDVLEKRLPRVSKRRVLPIYIWSSVASVAAVALLMITLFHQSFNAPSLQSPATSLIDTVVGSCTESDPVSMHSEDHRLLAKTHKPIEASSETADSLSIKASKTKDRSQKIDLKSVQQTKGTSEKESDPEESTTPTNNNEENPSWNEQEDDGSEYLVKHQGSDSVGTIVVSAPELALSIEQAQKLLEQQYAAQAEAYRQPDVKKRDRALQNPVSLGVLAAFTPDMEFMEFANTATVLGSNVLYRSASNIKKKHDLPISVGLSVEVPLAKRFGIQTGLNYTYIHSYFESANMLTSRFTHTNQSLHYLGIPVLFSYRIIDHRIVKFYVSAGGMGEKGLMNTQLIQHFNAEEELISSEQEQESISGFQWSLMANVGVGVTIYKGLSLYFEPGFSWYIPNEKEPQPDNMRTEHPYNLSLTAGLRFNVKN